MTFLRRATDSPKTNAMGYSGRYGAYWCHLFSFFANRPKKPRWGSTSSPERAANSLNSSSCLFTQMRGSLDLDLDHLVSPTESTQSRKPLLFNRNISYG